MKKWIVLLGASFSLSNALMSHAEEERLPELVPDQEEGAAAAQLPPEVVYWVLLGEIAGARGEFGVALEAYRQAYQKTHDPELAQRLEAIAQFAERSGAGRVVMLDDGYASVARLPKGASLNSDAIQFELAKILADSGDKLSANLLQLPKILSRLPNPERDGPPIIKRLTAPYLELPEAHLARSHVLGVGKDFNGALASARQALALRPDWNLAVLFQSQWLMQLERSEEAVELLQIFSDKQPDNIPMLEAYGRTLIDVGQLKAAREVFQKLRLARPEAEHYILSSAWIATELKQWDEAEHFFKQLLDIGYPADANIRIALGQLFEQKGDIEEALRWYASVPEGDQWKVARFRQVQLWVDQAQYDKAFAVLEQLKDKGEMRQELVEMTVFILQKANRFEEAFNFLEQERQARPDDIYILYQLALVSEKQGQRTLAEKYLRRAVRISPDDPDVLNALGYMLADRGVHLQEARTLIEKALSFEPENAYIIDSLGWLLFREQRLDEAEKTLRQAYAVNADPEIAAHLGEVLWAQGRPDKARQIWEDAWAKSPDNAILRKVRALHLLKAKE